MPNITVVMVPSIPVPHIPSGGGGFDFNISVTNGETSTQEFDVWIMTTLPTGVQYGPLSGPIALMLTGGETLNRDRTQYVPGNAPSGEYQYEAYVGLYPDTVWNSDDFPFVKDSAAGNDKVEERWRLLGEPLKSSGEEHFAKSVKIQLTVFPNPFNSSTVLTFNLPQPAMVSFEIFDTNGRRCRTALPAPEQFSSGTHTAFFDGSDLPSGIYFARLTAGEFQQTQKILLIK